MDPRDARAKLSNFLESLPEQVFSFLLDKNIEINILPIDIAAGYGFVLYETGNICEGVRRVLAGEDSAANLVTFIEQDKNIEEDNRGKIPQIAQEIQQKIFDPVLPILKQAGFEVKEGRVPAAPVVSPFAPQPSPISPISPIGPISPISPIRPSGPIGQAAPSPVSAPSASPIDERHLRALLRIATGTKYEEEELRNKFEDLPEGLRRAITSVDTANAVQEIAKKHLLHIDQMGALASETGLVLLGFTHPVYFVANLTSRLNVPQNKALEIARDVSAQVLSKVRDALRTLHESAQNPKSQVPNSNQIPNITIQTAQTQKQNIPTISSPALEPKSQKLKAGLTTPYSPEARWNTGAVESAKLKVESQGQQRNETPRPNGTVPYVPGRSSQPTTNNLQPTIKTTAPKVEPSPAKVQPSATAPSQPLRLPSTRAELGTGHSADSALPLGKGAEEKKEPNESFLEKKLNEPMSEPKRETRYTIDPYREPIE